MELIFEIIGQFLGELLIQLVAELLSEMGVRSVSEPFRRPRNAFIAGSGYLIFGAIAGGISLLILPSSLIRDPVLRGVNLFATPLALGLVMMRLGRFRSRKGQQLVRLDRFGYAFVFAFAMSLVRFNWA